MIKLDTLYRNNKNSEITFFAVCHSTYKEEEITGYLRDGTEKVYKLKYFKKNFTPVLPDYSVLEKHLLEYINQVPEVESVFQQILRRLHPGGYFHVGDIVYGTKEIGYYASHHRLEELISIPLEIVEIIKANEDSTTTRFIVMKQKHSISREEKLCIPIYQDRYSKIDAYACLKRYDMPY